MADESEAGAAGLRELYVDSDSGDFVGYVRRPIGILHTGLVGQP